VFGLGMRLTQGEVRFHLLAPEKVDSTRTPKWKKGRLAQRVVGIGIDA
jgi:hypothetical protein